MGHRHLVALVVGVGGLLALAPVSAAWEGAGYFEAVGEGYGRDTTFQIALGDLDGDGDLDAVFANQGRFPSRVLLNDGSGVFTYTHQELTGNGHGVGLGDLDGDGDLDIFITCAYAFGISRPSKIYLNDGQGTFADSGQDLGDTALSGNLVQLVDIDGDGDLDAYVSYLTVPGREFLGYVYRNDGGLFQLSDHAFAYGTFFADLDRDGDADAVEKMPAGYRVRSNDGAGGFAETWALEDPSLDYGVWSLAAADLDEDGDVDLFDTNGTWTQAGKTYVLFADGQGGYARSTVAVPDLSTAWPILADFNGDGHTDVFLSLMVGEDQLWLGDGAGGFTDSGVRLGGDDSRGAAAGDLDGDGDLDLFVPVYGMTGGPNLVWRNIHGD